MSKYTDLAMKRRTKIMPDGHPAWNCCQSVAAIFAKDAGYDEDAAMDAATFFRGGMQMGSVCGAVTGGLMVLGLAGLKGPEVTDAYYGKFRERHGDMINCADLLRAGAERGEQKLPWCNALIRECIGYVEEALREQGKL